MDGPGFGLLAQTSVDFPVNVDWAGTRYAGANHTHLSELLSERDGIDMGRTTLRRILVNSGLSSPRRRRPPKHRVRRQRMPREGMLVQLDGSYHRWLGEDGPQFTILFAVDDATGCVPGALFCDHEDTSSYFLLMQGLIRRRGIPLALYTDRHAVFKRRSEYQPAGTPTQFGRAMEELGTQLIFALSPQAKGRVERTAGTFQDRLITELRLAGATTVEQAKAVLRVVDAPEFRVELAEKLIGFAVSVYLHAVLGFMLHFVFYGVFHLGGVVVVAVGLIGRAVFG